jgi:hypothetical protein
MLVLNQKEILPKVMIHSYKDVTEALIGSSEKEYNQIPYIFTAVPGSRTERYPVERLSRKEQRGSKKENMPVFGKSLYQLFPVHRQALPPLRPDRFP